MRLLAGAFLALLTLAPPGAAQALRVVAVADFVDETVDGYQIGAVRLSAELQAYLAAQGRDRLRVVAVDEVRAAMRARGYAPADLVSPTKAAEIAQAVGADWLITGRWVYLDLDRERQAGVRVPALAQAVIEIRVLQASTRRTLLSDTFSGIGFGLTNAFLLRQAARVALQRAAARISNL